MKPKVLAAFMAVVSILVVPGAMSAQADDDARTQAAMVAEAVRMQQMFMELYNARKFEELGARYYAEDAIALPPNHEPIRGRAALWSTSVAPATPWVKGRSAAHSWRHRSAETSSPSCRSTQPTKASSALSPTSSTNASPTAPCSASRTNSASATRCGSRVACVNRLVP